LTYYTRINSISIDENGNYVVDYETFGYTETLPGMHVHFFFNTVPPDQAGKPGKGPWILYGGPRPFTKYKVSDRPDGATQMCILVANPDHSVQPNSGNCVDLPDVPQTGSSEATPQITMDNYDVPMVFIPGGEFTMGSDSGDPDEKPVHTVSVNDFYIDEFEVTNSQYARCVDESYCDPPSDTSSATRDSYYGNPDFSDYPVVFVSWQDANEFCEWRGARLPTEAEWEKAARGTDGRTYPWGEDISCEMTNYNNCVGDTTEVGYYPSDVSPYGVYDMAGNVREVVADLYDVYPGGDPSASMDFGSDMVVARGGWFKGNAGQSRAANRTSRAKDEAHNLVGFRCARDGN
jgi:formylglycine-generating enzyme required for sulfatase activity